MSTRTEVGNALSELFGLSWSDCFDVQSLPKHRFRYPQQSKIKERLFNLCSVQATETEWKQEYLHGASMEIYRTRLPIVFNERTFSEAARILFDQFGIVLIGIEITDPNRSLSSNDFNPEIYIAPMDYVRSFCFLGK